MKKLVNGKEITVSAKQETEILAEWAKNDLRKQDYIAKELYKDQRRTSYPAIGDQLDAILKQLNYMQMSGQTDLITELDGIVNKWLAVKRKYPKEK
jgi:hypothetical protein